MIIHLKLHWLDPNQIHCVESQNSKAYAYARIWGLNKLWQTVLSQKPTYIIEVLSERYHHLSREKKDHVLLHELAHIPKNFSGALLAHRKQGKGSFHDKLQKMIVSYENLRE